MHKIIDLFLFGCLIFHSGSGCAGPLLIVCLESTNRLFQTVENQRDN